MEMSYGGRELPVLRLLFLLVGGFEERWVVSALNAIVGCDEANNLKIGAMISGDCVDR
jgi:hypothetical protein